MLMNLTRFLSRALCFPFLPRPRGAGADESGDSTQQFGTQTHRTRERERSDDVDSQKYSSESTVGKRTECILITHIRATDVAIRLRRIPVGFYVTVKSGNVTKRTSNKPVLVGKDIVEWDDEIALPSDRTSRMSLTLYASFELGQTLGVGEFLCKFEVTAGELLDRNEQLQIVRLLEQSEREALTSPSSLEIQIERRIYGRNEYTAASNPPESEEMDQLEELTTEGHHALIRYRELLEQRDLDESIRYFEHARDQCPLGHPSRGTVLFNLATAKLIYCRVNDVFPGLDVPIDLYRAVLRLRPRGHPDHPFTLLSLGVALEARFQRERHEADGAEGDSLLSQVLDVAPADSYAYHAAILALGITAESELIQPTEIAQTIENDLDDNGKVQRLDAALQWMFYPHSCGHASLDHLGILFCIRLDRLGDFADPEKSISVLEVAVQFASDNHPDKTSWLGDLGGLLLTRYMHSGNLIDLDKSISMSEVAVRLTPEGHSDKPPWLNKLGRSLVTRYERHGDIVDLEKSILMKEGAVQSAPDGHPDKPLWLNSLGESLFTRYQRFGDINDLEKSISMLEDAVQFTPDGHPSKPGRLNNLSSSLSTRYNRFGDVVDLEKSISMFEDLVELTPDGHPNKPVWLNNLGHSLKSRYEHFGDVVDLERSISMGEVAVQFTPDDHPKKPFYLNNLGHLLSTRYERFGDLADLERSISTTDNAVQFTPDGHPDRAARLNNLGDSLLSRYQHFGNVIDLGKSIAMFEDAMQSTPDGHPDMALRLNNLGHSLWTRYERFGDIIDLEKSMLMREDVVRLTPDDHTDKPSRLSHLGSSFSTRYERFGDVADLERSISIKEDVVRLTPDGHPNKPVWLNNLGHSLQSRYKRLGNVVDLDRSISMTEDAVQLTPDGHQDKPLRLNNIGSLLWTRYQRFGDAVDLERSISMRQDAVQSTPDGHRNKPFLLNNLGHSMWTRYERFGDIVDLENSISMTEEAVKLTPDGHPDKLVWLSNLGHSLGTRYRRLGDVVDLRRSISIREDVVRFAPDGHPHRPSWLNNLGHSLMARYEHFEDVDDLEKSISMFKEALQFTPDGNPDKASWLNNLGDSLLTRYQRFGDVNDLEKSISMFEDVARLTPDGHPDKIPRLNSLTFSLLERFQRSSDLSGSDLSRAISYSSCAARSHTGSSPNRFQASQLWSRCVRLRRHDSQSLLDAYTIAVDLIPQLAWIGLSFHDRYHQLLRAADEVCDAAAAALEAHMPELAVEWLEQGRSTVWSQLSQLRTPVDDIRTAYPELAGQFERVSHQLEHTSSRDRAATSEFTNHSTMIGELSEEQAQQNHALALSREKLLAEIRAQPGFERFLLPKTIEQLSSLAHSGPVVFLNASRHRCDALVVVAGSQRVVHVPLSNTNYDEVVGMQLQLNKLLRLNGRATLRDDSGRGARLHRMGPDDVFRSILSHLWDKVVSPILEALAFSTSDPKLSRIFWCPTGPFTFLPIHAAGIYGTAKPGPRLSDFVISSYIPTMSALELPSQEDSEATLRGIRLLAVRQPSTDGQARLTSVPREMDIIRELTSLSPLVGFQEADGTVEDVLAKMKEADWVHFACHGIQDRTKPFDSGLLLAHRRRLKLSNIAQLPRPHGGLAFLSACQTATGDEQLSEEAIHIAAGMLLAGYSGVIATMWSIMDNDAPRVTEDVYKSLLHDGRVPDTKQAAEALHHAIERLRDSGVPFLSWVPFIHVGL